MVNTVNSESHQLILNSVTDETDENVDIEEGQQWSTVRSRKKRKLTSSGQQAAGLASVSVTSNAARLAGSTRSKNDTWATTVAKSKPKPRRPIVVGNKTSSSSGTNSVTVKAAKPYVNKVFYCVDNLCMSTTTEDITRLVTAMSVRVVSCYETKPRRSYMQRQSNITPDRKAYRLCIDRDDKVKLLLAENWPADITVSTWRFKTKDSNDHRTKGNLTAPQHDNALSANIAENIATIRGNLTCHSQQSNVDVIAADVDQTTIYDPYDQAAFTHSDIDFPTLGAIAISDS